MNLQANARLKQLLAERQQHKSETGTALTQFGLEQITDVAKYLKERIASWNTGIPDYDPLLEIAKIAFTTDKDDLSFRCHQELAKYQYPQIRSLEVQSKADKEITVKVELASYAVGKYSTEGASYAAGYPEKGVVKGISEGEVEDIESEGDIDAEETSELDLEELDKKEPKKKSSDYLDQVFEQSQKKGREL